jgi:2-polyprenyl-3-methyl-5-hydroxy-6-metoxy-1,4-benzoquinol methylase
MNVPEFVKKELIDFTGLSPREVDLYVGRKQYPTFQDEWKLWKPDTDQNIRWFYICSRGYLFANAIHVLAPNILNDIPKGSKVLDFGGGSGNYSFALCDKGCSVDFFEVNLLQKEFVKFVAKKHSLDLMALDYNASFLPIISNTYDSIIALDVLEHIPNYDEYIQMFASAIKPGGCLYVFAPFGGGGDVTHLSDKLGFDKVLAKYGFAFDSNIVIREGVNCSKYRGKK